MATQEEINKALNLRLKEIVSGMGVLATQSDDHEKRLTTLEKENAALKKEIEALKKKVK